jgi:hypothetical protein
VVLQQLNSCQPSLDHQDGHMHGEYGHWQCHRRQPHQMKAAFNGPKEKLALSSALADGSPRLTLIYDLQENRFPHTDIFSDNS